MAVTLLQLSVESLNLAREAPSLPGQRRLAPRLADQAGAGDTRRVGLGDGVRMAGFSGIVAGHHQRRHLHALEPGHGHERPRSRHRAQCRDQCAKVAVAFHPFASEAQDRVAPARVDALNAVDVGDEAVNSVLLERGGKPVPVAQRFLADLTLVSRPDHDQPSDEAWVLEGKADGRVGAHRVSRQQYGLSAGLLFDHGRQVRPQLRVSITRAHRRRVGFAVAASVVADHRVARPLEPARAVDNRVAAGGDAVTEHDRLSLPHRLTANRRRGADAERDRLRRHQPTEATACSRSSTDSKLRPTNVTLRWRMIPCSSMTKTARRTIGPASTPYALATNLSSSASNGTLRLFSWVKRSCDSTDCGEIPSTSAPS